MKASPLALIFAADVLPTVFAASFPWTTSAAVAADEPERKPG